MDAVSGCDQSGISLSESRRERRARVGRKGTHDHL